VNTEEASAEGKEGGEGEKVRKYWVKVV